MDDPEALIAGLRKNNNAGNGESGGGTERGKRRKRKRRSPIRSSERLKTGDLTKFIIFMPFHQGFLCFHVFSTAPSAAHAGRGNLYII